MVKATCERCGAVLAASDEETLAWGIDGHVCRLSKLEAFAESLRPLRRRVRRRGVSVSGERRDQVELGVVEWLAGEYGGSFLWCRPGSLPLVVVVSGG